MNYSSYVNMIKELGLTEYEAKCYLALFERESLTAIEVMSLAGIPRPNTYEALKKLLAKGLCVSMPGKTKRFAAADPLLLKEKASDFIDNTLDIEIGQLEKKKEHLVEKRQRINENVDSAISYLKVLYDNGRENCNPLDYIEILREPNQIHRRYLKLCEESTSEIIFFIKPPYTFTNPIQEIEQIKAQNDAQERGVKVRYICELPADEDRQIKMCRNIMEGVRHPNDQPRVIEELPLKLGIFDQSVVLFTLLDPLQGRVSLTSLIARHKSMAIGFKLLFESYWERARDYFFEGDRKIYFADNLKDKRQDSGGGN
jgi:HTH-type transcriptional regulator, sugar sensing transcriptional regulator